ncbi:hypothetical protein GJ496_004286 [Pomphorhynchus laevis]|nr:hypothetical protein GJ496_004286 [Pomphorhynchus laevis]
MLRRWNDQGGSRNKVDSAGNNPIRSVILSKNIDLLKYLLQYELNPNLCYNEDSTLKLTYWTIIVLKHCGFYVMKTKSELARLIKERIPEVDGLARAGEVQKALDILHSLEKESRIVNDVSSNKEIIIKIAELCIDTNRWDKLCDEIILLSKRKGLLKQAFVCLIEAGCEYVDQTPNREIKLSLIQALRQASTGKMQVELHRARLTRQLAMMKEQEGDIAAAAEILQELHIENTVVVDPEEKIDFVLEQIRLCLANKDYAKASIVSKRVNVDFFDGKIRTDLETKYFLMMINLDLHDKEYFKVCQYYIRLHDVYKREGNEDASMEMLRFAILFILLSIFEPEQVDLMQRILQNYGKSIRLMPTVFGYLLKKFTSKELIHWPSICSEYEHSLRSETSMGQLVHKTGLFSDDEEGELLWNELCNRVIEFNVRIIATYYTEIKLDRMAELLNLTAQKMESILCDLVIKKVAERKDSKELMTELVGNWSTLMNMVETAVHLINREEMANATRVS